MSALAPPESSDPLVGSVLGRHLLVRLLGEGGMGVVYEGTHQDLGRRAAIKILHPRYARSDEVRVRFVREGQAASRVRHPNVVHVYDVGVESSQPYLVMEYLEGEDLGRLIAGEGILSAQRTADLLTPVVAAVAAAHELGVVHRDLKPENIFVAVERGRIKPKVLDFGISKIIDRTPAEPLTGTGAFLGTPQYMSPEQAQGARHLDHRSDQYSLGVILYQCVTGRRPLEEPSIYALIQRIVRGDFPPPRQLSADLPVAFEALILRAMARDPEERFSSTRALGLALLEFASPRILAQYADELAVDALGPTATERPVPAPEARRAGTTLGESVAQRDLLAVSRPARRWLGVALVAIAVGSALLARTWSRSRSSLGPNPNAGPAAAVEGPAALLAASLSPLSPAAPLAEASKPASSAFESASPSAGTVQKPAERKPAPRVPVTSFPRKAAAPSGAAPPTPPAAPSSPPTSESQPAAESAPSDPYAAQK